MFTKKIFVSVFVLFLALILIIGGCTFPPLTGDTYTITASSNAGGTIEPSGEITVNKGDSITFTFTPDEGYEVGCIKVEGTCIGSGGIYTVENVNQDFTIHVLFAEEGVPLETHTVTFEVNGGSAVPSQTVVDGSTATQPVDPTRTGYTFAGWYEDAGLTTAFNFSTPITADTTIYAQWTEVIEYTVTFDKNGGDTEAVPTTKTALSGGTVGTLPTPPTRTGYTFNGWNTAANGSGTVFTASTPVNASITVYAQWIITVCSTGANYTSIQTAINNAVDNDVIKVCAGTYNEDISFVGGTKSIIVQSEDGASFTTITGSGSGSVVTFTGGNTSTLDGFTIQGGGAVTTALGGGIYIEGSSPNISNNIITGNVATYGGGICVDAINGNASPNITGNTISSNTATDGGGINISIVLAGSYTNTSTVNGNVITSNTATQFGGGICVYHATPAIGSNTITGNTPNDTIYYY